MIMKIVAGMGSIEEYESLITAGVDEVFCGYVPASWYEKYGNFRPLNRREVRFYHVQIGSMEDMKILAKMMQDLKVPVTLTFNALYYMPEQYEEIGNLIEQLLMLGFGRYIISDLALLRYLQKRKLPCKIHISGEIGEVNPSYLDFVEETFDTKKYVQDVQTNLNNQIISKNENKKDIKKENENKSDGLQIVRQIFHRKNTLQNMASCIQHQEQAGRKMEYEAFVLNELCQYTGGFCNSLHCDELVHLCQLPYQVVPLHGSNQSNVYQAGEIMKDAENDKEGSYIENAEELQIENDSADENIPGETGCGLCALYQMKQAGITHLKVVGRGNQLENMVRDVSSLKRALEILEQTSSEDEFKIEVQRELFKKGCSKRCYYFCECNI